MCAAHFNSVNLVGKVTAPPEVSHVSHGSTILRFLLSSERLSGAADELPVICRRETVGDLPLAVGTRFALEGEIRSYNNRSGTGNRLCLSVFSRSLQISEEQDRNEVMLAGSICKPPIFRETPLGREIADVMLAINRRYRKSDYIPVILWGSNARRAAKLAVGSYIAFEGRMQSRRYIKNLGERSEERVAYEVSVNHLIEEISERVFSVSYFPPEGAEEAASSI